MQYLVLEATAVQVLLLLLTAQLPHTLVVAAEGFQMHIQLLQEE